jgi:hypothetical protein
VRQIFSAITDKKTTTRRNGVKSDFALEKASSRRSHYVLFFQVALRIDPLIKSRAVRVSMIVPFTPIAIERTSMAHR